MKRIINKTKLKFTTKLKCWRRALVKVQECGTKRGLFAAHDLWSHPGEMSAAQTRHIRGLRPWVCSEATCNQYEKFFRTQLLVQTVGHPTWIHQGKKRHYRFSRCLLLKLVVPEGLFKMPQSVCRYLHPVPRYGYRKISAFS